MAAPQPLTWAGRKLGQAALWLVRKGLGERIFAGMVGGWGYGTSPGAWSGNRIEQVQHYRHWVYRAVQTIMTLATKELPVVASVVPKPEANAHKHAVKLWEQGKGPQPKEFRRFLTESVRRKSLNAVKPHEDLEYLDASHDLMRLLNRPNRWDTGGDLWRELLLFIELTGNGYLWKVPRRDGRGIAELWVMPSHWVWPQTTGKRDLIEWYEVRPWGQSGTANPLRFEADELIHFRTKNPLNKLDGYSTLSAAAEVIDVYESIQLSRFYALKEGAQIGATFETDASYDPDDQVLKRFEAKLFAKYAGEAGFNRPAILPPGMKLIRAPEGVELSHIASSDQMMTYVLGMWGISKSIMGFMEDANRASFETALAHCFYFVINPRLSFIGEVLTEQLIKPNYGEDLRLFWKDMTPADRQAELGEWNLLLNKGMHKPNEYRQWMGLETLDEGDEVIAPMGSAPIGADPFGEMDDTELMGRMRGMGDRESSQGEQ